MNQKKYSGFTLIGMALLLGMISIILVAGIMWTSASYKDKQVQRAKLDAEQWLQASLDYYDKHKAWPTLDKLVSDGYMEQSMDTNPWGKKYKLKTITIGSSQTIEIETDTITPEEATQLANLLPGGSASGTTVTAYFIPSTELVAAKGYIIKSIQFASDGDKIPLAPYHCPSHHHIDAFGSLKRIYNNEVYSVPPGYDNSVYQIAVELNIINNFVHVTQKVNEGSGDKNQSSKARIIIACVPD